MSTTGSARATPAASCASTSICPDAVFDGLRGGPTSGRGRPEAPTLTVVDVVNTCSSGDAESRGVAGKAAARGPRGKPDDDPRLAHARRAAALIGSVDERLGVLGERLLDEAGSAGDAGAWHE